MDFGLSCSHRQHVFESRLKFVRHSPGLEPAQFALEQLRVSLVHVNTCLVNFRSSDMPYR